MSISCDIYLEEKFNIHFSFIPQLSLIIVNDLNDFGEYWLEVKVVEEWKSNPMYHFSTLSGGSNDELIHACTRSFVDILLKCIHRKAGPSMEKVGFTWKFIINISLRSEILNNPDYIKTISNSIQKLLNDKVKGEKGFFHFSEIHSEQEISHQQVSR